jgi:putative ABC transport system permease protein
VTAGDAGGLARGEVLVDEDELDKQNFHIGDMLPMTFARTGERQLRIAGTYAQNQLLGKYLVSTATFDANFTDRLDFVVLATAAPGTSPAAARAAVERVTADFPNVEVRDQTEFKETQKDQINQALGLVSALLGLAILIALFGIVNTLALSIFERVRELGLLRAVGATRRQLRSMIRWEGVIIAVLGAVLGLVIGAFFGWTMVRALKGEGFTTFAVPGGQLVAYVVAAGLAGILAAVLPGRRAAKVDMLRAIATE